MIYFFRFGEWTYSTIEQAHLHPTKIVCISYLTVNCVYLPIAFWWNSCMHCMPSSTQLTFPYFRWNWLFGGKIIFLRSFNRSTNKHLCSMQSNKYDLNLLNDSWWNVLWIYLFWFFLNSMIKYMLMYFHHTY